jgi:hypothetical protein
VHPRKPVWKTSSFLVYTGGLTVLGGAIAALAYLSGHYGKGAITGWALLLLVILRFIAETLRFSKRWVAAGIFAFISLIVWGVFLALAWDWFGWVSNWNSAFGGWSLGHLSLEFLILAAALSDHRRWNFPLIALISAVVSWFFVTDFVSNGGTWTYVVTLVIGLAYLLAGTVADTPSGFWLHFVAGVLIGVPLLRWWHTTDLHWALISATALAYVLVAYVTRRSSWSVFATLGFFGATIHFLVGSPTSIASDAVNGTPPPHVSPWAPALAFGLLGFWLVLLGLLGRRSTIAVPPADEVWADVPPAAVPPPA